MDKDYIRLAFAAILIIAALWNNTISDEMFLLLIAGLMFPTTAAFQNATEIASRLKNSTR